MVGASTGCTPGSGPRSHGSTGSAAMMMNLRNSQAVDGVAFEIEFDQDRRFISHHPTFMSRFHANELRRLELLHATVCKTDVDLAARHESDVSVHAIFAAH